VTGLRLVHDLDRALALERDGVTLFRYVYRPDTPALESPKPYFHPVHTLRGNLVTAFRPHDHVWHKGMAMTAAHLSGQNFWGGPTYVRDQGYVQLENNGTVEHLEWEEIGSELSMHERLRWLTADGAPWLREERWIDLAEIDLEASSWALDLTFQLTNGSPQELVFSSPTVEGRPLAGYGGLFWRGPRDFTGGQILAGGGREGPEVMGQAAPWLAFVGHHDGSGDSSTVLFVDHPDNVRYPTKWFVRTTPYACASAAFMFDQPYVLPPDHGLLLRYRVVVADGALSRERLDAQAAAFAAERLAQPPTPSSPSPPAEG
jgi:hypothetical protein